MLRQYFFLYELTPITCILKHVEINCYGQNVSSVAETFWVIIVKIIKRIKVCGVNMITTRLKWQETRLSKVRGNSGIASHSRTRVHSSTKCCYH
jgi:hypothetical protein